MRILWTHNYNPADPFSLVNIDVAAEGLRRLGVDLHLEYIGNLRSVSGLWRARQHVRRVARGFDVVHAQYGSACGLATAAAQGVPRVLSVRGNDWNVYSESSAFFYVHTRLARAMTRLALGRYERVICVSRRMAAELSRRIPASRVVTMPSPLDERFVPRDRAAARAELGFPDNRERWILFNAINLDDPIKRFPLAQQAFDLANARAGGTLRLRLATQLPYDTLPLFVAACDLILCTSETEGWPNSVKEALACNVPFVSTDVSDLGDIAAVEPTCRVCEATPEALAAGIGEALAASDAAGAPPDLRRHVAGMRLDLSSGQLKQIYQQLMTSSVH